MAPCEPVNCPVIVAYRVSWPDQKFIYGTLEDIRDKVQKYKISRTALILVGRVFGKLDFPDSALYDPLHAHILRPKKRQQK